jgi:hypothetical protein
MRAAGGAPGQCTWCGCQWRGVLRVQAQPGRCSGVDVFFLALARARVVVAAQSTRCSKQLRRMLGCLRVARRWRCTCCRSAVRCVFLRLHVLAAHTVASRVTHLCVCRVQHLLCPGTARRSLAGPSFTRLQCCLRGCAHCNSSLPLWPLLLSWLFVVVERAGLLSARQVCHSKQPGTKHTLCRCVCVCVCVCVCCAPPCTSRTALSRGRVRAQSVRVRCWSLAVHTLLWQAGCSGCSSSVACHSATAGGDRSWQALPGYAWQQQQRHASCLVCHVGASWHPTCTAGCHSPCVCLHTGLH